MAFFPIYINSQDYNCLVVGGGKVAARKVQMLLDFDMQVTVVAKDICDELKNMVNSNRLIFENRPFRNEDIRGKQLIVAATNNRKVNHEIACAARDNNILVNVVDNKEESTFIFPAYIKEKDIVVSFSSGGNSPLVTQYLKDKTREIVTPKLGEVNNYLGEIREKVKNNYPEQERKKIYQDIFDEAMRHLLS